MMKTFFSSAITKNDDKKTVCLIVSLECSVGRGPGTPCGDVSGGKVSAKGPSFLL